MRHKGCPGKKVPPRGYDTSKCVLAVEPGTKFKIIGRDNKVFVQPDSTIEPEYIRLGGERGQFPEPHICSPWTTVPAVRVRDWEGNKVFELAWLPVRTDVEVIQEEKDGY